MTAPSRESHINYCMQCCNAYKLQVLFLRLICKCTILFQFCVGLASYQYNPVGWLGHWQEIYIAILHTRTQKQTTNWLTANIWRKTIWSEIAIWKLAFLQKVAFWLSFTKSFVLKILEFSSDKILLLWKIRYCNSCFWHQIFLKTLWLSSCGDYILVLFVHLLVQVTFLRRTCHLFKCCHHKFSNIWHQK